MLFRIVHITIGERELGRREREAWIGAVARASLGFGEISRGLRQIAQTRRAERQIVKHGGRCFRRFGGPHECFRGFPPRSAAGLHQAEVETRNTIAFAQFEYTTELAFGFVEHACTIERHAEISMLRHLALGRRLPTGGAASHPLDVTGREQTVQRLAHVELPQPRSFDDGGHIVCAIEHGQETLLHFAQRHLALRHPRAIYLEDEVETRNLLFDQRPLIDTAGAFKQQRIGTDGEEWRLAPRVLVGLERERTVRPSEQMVDGFLHLLMILSQHRVPRNGAQGEQGVRQFTIVVRRNAGLQTREIVSRDHPQAHETIAQPVTTIDQGRMHDTTVGEVDGAEAAFPRDAEAARLLSEREQLQDIREARFTEIATNGHSADPHQRYSSMRRPPSSGQSHIVFSRSS